MEKLGFAIGVNIILHDEGDLLYKTFRALAVAYRYCRKQNDKITIRTHIVLDEADEKTSFYFSRSRGILENASDFFVAEDLSCNDPSVCRNRMIDACLQDQVRFLYFQDGSDIISNNCLYEMYKTVSESEKGTPLAAVPEYSMNLRDWIGLKDSDIQHYWSSNDERQSLTSFYTIDIYPRILFADHRIFEQLRYTPVGTEYYDEISHLQREIVANGYPILTAPRTFVLLRIRPDTFYPQRGNQPLCIAPSAFFSPEVFRNLKHIPVETFSDVEYNSACHRNKKFLKPGPVQDLHLDPSHAKNLFLLAKQGMNEVTGCIEVESGIVKQKMGVVDHTTARLRMQDNIRTIDEQGFDRQMRKGIRQLNGIEPLCVYDNHWLTYTSVWAVTREFMVDELYYRLCSMPQIEQTTDIIIMLEMEASGANKAILDQARALSDQGRKILIITNNVSKDTWKDKARAISGVTLLTRTEFFRPEYINDSDMQTMLLRIVQNWPNLKTLTVMNSGIGCDLVRNYSRELRKHVKIILYSWCYYLNNQNMLDEPFLISRLYDKVDEILVDGPAYKKQLEQINGWTGEKIHVINLPIRDVHVKKHYEQTKKIFYAGRFCRQKRIDLLTDILPALQKEGISVDFWGTVDENDIDYEIRRNKDMAAIRKAPNAQYRGPFNDFSMIPIDEYDLMILPTQFEGLPNIVLEALKSNEYVIAGSAGSLPYVIQNHKNGFLVKENGSAEAYLNAILGFYHSNETNVSPDERYAFNHDILAGHDDRIYKESIAQIFA